MVDTTNPLNMRQNNQYISNTNVDDVHIQACVFTSENTYFTHLIKNYIHECWVLQK